MGVSAEVNTVIREEANVVQDPRIPITLLTGFLGSGKTTLLNAWLKSEEFSTAAVIVNEFGEIGIDHSLIRSASENAVALTNGCLCCTPRGDIARTLQDLIDQRDAGNISGCDRIIIETSGLADPVPVLQALLTLPIVREFRLANVIATLDAVHGLATLKLHPEALQQIGVADAVVITKVDLCPGAAERLIKQLRQYNPGARVYTSSCDAAPSPADVITATLCYAGAEPSMIAGWLNAAAYAGEADHAPTPLHGGHSHHSHRHTVGISSYSLRFAEPFHWHHIAGWFNALASVTGDKILRIKGIIDVIDRECPVVVQVVQHLFYPPFELTKYDQNNHCSQIVFITRDVPRELVLSVLDIVRTR